jgi:hypothetical protein
VKTHRCEPLSRLAPVVSWQAMTVRGALLQARPEGKFPSITEEIFERWMDAFEKEALRKDPPPALHDEEVEVGFSGVAFRRRVAGQRKTRHDSAAQYTPCCVCWHVGGTDRNSLVFCSRCHLAVHMGCYGIERKRGGSHHRATLGGRPWFCTRCEADVAQVRQKAAATAAVAAIAPAATEVAAAAADVPAASAATTSSPASAPAAPGALAAAANPDAIKSAIGDVGAAAAATAATASAASAASAGIGTNVDSSGSVGQPPAADGAAGAADPATSDAGSPKAAAGAVSTSPRAPPAQVVPGWGVGSGQCCLCPVKGGALKPTDDGRWCHLVCAIWIPEPCISDIARMQPIERINQISSKRRQLKCAICTTDNDGPCIECSEPGCTVAFHPSCAYTASPDYCLQASLQADRQAVSFEAFCPQHNTRMIERCVRLLSHTDAVICMCHTMLHAPCTAVPILSSATHAFIHD